MVDIVVIGSLNMDLVTKILRMPKPGETVRGDDVKMIPGGKGANQAAAAAKLGTKVAMVGKVGSDAFGIPLIENLKQIGIDISKVGIEPNTATGIALIVVDEKGQNSIVISPGANSTLAESDVDTEIKLITNAKYLLLQFEIPVKTWEYSLQLAHENKVKVILNPAPAGEIGPDIYPMIDYLVPNETELMLLTGIKVTDLESAKIAGLQLLNRGVKVVIVTMGEKGALLLTQDEVELIPSHEVNVVDTTAAGDAFIGGFATGLCQGLPLKKAVKYGCATGALAVTKLGAQKSLPTKAEVENLLIRI